VNNYEYIIASLPILTQGDKAVFDEETVLQEIRSQLSPKDLTLFENFLEGYKEGALTQEFYRNALKNRNHFLQAYYRFDLTLKNAKVSYLNNRLGRPENQDRIELETPDQDELEAINSVLEQQDLLSREKGLDTLVWDKVDELTKMSLFCMDNILSCIVKIKIISRWTKLDPQKGREFFRRLVEEIKDNYTI